MLHHKESPEKPHYNMITPYFQTNSFTPILHYPSPFVAMIFRHHISVNFGKVEPPFLLRREGFELCSRPSNMLDM